MQEKFPIDKLEARLRRVEASKTGSYDKRTEHLDANGKALFINRLILEDSPYLLQHAHNPVNWYGWGSEAFEAARREHKPVFLSIGYSTCHWCHVMEVESFDNVEVAKILNRHFISIKLDREQYPDIDEVYMTGVQIISGHGGWPMSNFLLADGKQFFGATYFPAAGFIQLLHQVVDAWQHKYAELEQSATQISTAIERYLAARNPAAEFDPAVPETLLEALLQREDRSFGGLAGAPKFPQEPLLLWMLERVARQRELAALAFIERALECMASGGIYDQVAGGFHRYSVDAQWLVPHFEKMLYNQSQLGLVYLRAWQYTQNPFLRRVCTQTLDYVVRDMQLPAGGFYSATDADSEGEEGTFFVWRVAELEAELAPEAMQLLRHVYDISAGGNFEGSNILSLRKSLPQIARESGRDDFYPALDAILHKLFLARERRIHPLRDDKLIVAWNGAMITTLARAAFVLDNPAWLAAAERAANHIWQQNVVHPDRANSSCANSPGANSQGKSPDLEHPDERVRLRRIFLNGAVSIDGQLEDYANLAEALLALFDITSTLHYLQRAVALLGAAMAEFYDAEAESFYLSPSRKDGPGLTRSRSVSDGATVSAVATMLQCLLAWQRRHALVPDSFPLLDLQTRTMACLNALGGVFNDNPMSHPSLLRVVAQQAGGSIETIQFAGNGLVRLAVHRQAQDAASMAVRCTLTLQPGWHVTAPQSGLDSATYQPLQVHSAAAETHWSLKPCEFPRTRHSVQDARGEQVPVYTGTIEFTAHFQRTAAPADALEQSLGFGVTLQLCNDRHCLLPETLQFRC